MIWFGMTLCLSRTQLKWTGKRSFRFISKPAHMAEQKEDTDHKETENQHR